MSFFRVFRPVTPFLVSYSILKCVYIFSLGKKKRFSKRETEKSFTSDIRYIFWRIFLYYYIIIIIISTLLFYTQNYCETLNYRCTNKVNFAFFFARLKMGHTITLIRFYLVIIIIMFIFFCFYFGLSLRCVWTTLLNFFIDFDFVSQLVLINSLVKTLISTLFHFL